MTEDLQVAVENMPRNLHEPVSLAAHIIKFIAFLLLVGGLGAGYYCLERFNSLLPFLPRSLDASWGTTAAMVLWISTAIFCTVLYGFGEIVKNVYQLNQRQKRQARTL